MSKSAWQIGLVFGYTPKKMQHQENDVNRMVVKSQKDRYKLIDELSFLVQKATEQARQALAITSNANYGIGFAEGCIYDTEQCFIYCCCAVVSNSREVGTCISDRIPTPRSLYQKCLSGELSTTDIEGYITRFYPDLYGELVRGAILSAKKIEETTCKFADDVGYR